MKIADIFPLICYLVFSITPAHAGGKMDSLYKVLRIKTKGDYFVIYARRNDSLFKIISKNVLVDNTTDLEKLRKGKSYYFEFGKYDDITHLAPLIGNGSYLHIKYSDFLKMVQQESGLKRDFIIGYISPKILLAYIILVHLFDDRCPVLPTQ